MNTKLTIRQEFVLNKLNQYIDEFGFPPTHVNLAEMVDIASPRAVADHLKAIERKGYIKIYPGIPRGIQVLNKENQ